MFMFMFMFVMCVCSKVWLLPAQVRGIVPLAHEKRIKTVKPEDHPLAAVNSDSHFALDPALGAENLAVIP